MTGRRRRWGAFILLEVLVAMVILGVAFVAILRGFVLCLESMRQVRLNEEAVYLGETMLADLQLELPREGRYRGRFADDARFGQDFARYSFDIEVREMEPRYREKARGTLRQDLEPAHEATIRILFQDDRMPEPVTRLTLNTFLLDATIFSNNAIQSNQLF